MNDKTSTKLSELVYKLTVDIDNTLRNYHWPYKIDINKYEPLLKEIVSYAVAYGDAMSNLLVENVIEELKKS